VSQRRAGIVNRCPECRINNNLCVCADIKPFEVSNLISLIVHVRELKLTSNTAQFIEKLLPNQAEIFIRGRVNDNFDSTPVVARPGLPLFLYPHEDAVELNADFVKNNPGPYHIVIPDGNWHQARRVRRREEHFKNMVAVKLPPGLIGEYQLRRAPQPEWVSTYEAVAHALGILEGPEVTEKLMMFFRKWVQATLKSRSGDFSQEEEF
jgi:DTW domain-containing protein